MKLPPLFPVLRLVLIVGVCFSLSSCFTPWGHNPLHHKHWKHLDGHPGNHHHGYKMKPKDKAKYRGFYIP
ncbi:hypothetical protein [Roseimicrobium gellanilyticum]|uniref:hypothetical protein n=1 Tax=Roseimicrobium gellanilyticum TaxID=748857 RepID=UPI001475471C|nr:hypothetical protein [Roseimicrobium gellanilyticum]